MADKHLLLVLGMHRSGTSAMTRVLAQFAEATLPEPLLGPAHGNLYGHWEPFEALALNDTFLRSFASAPFDPGLHVQLRSSVTVGQAQDFESKVCAFLASHFVHTQRLIVKDPRISSLTGFWLSAAARLGCRISIVYMVRHPTHVAASLFDRDRLLPEHAKALWLKYNLSCERDSRAASRVFVHFDQFQDDWRATLQHVSDTLGLNFAVDERKAEFIDAFLKTNARRPAPAKFGMSLTEQWTSTVYDCLTAAASGRAINFSDMDRCFKEVADTDAMYRVSYQTYIKRFQPELASPLVDQELRRQDVQMVLYDEILLSDAGVAGKYSRIVGKIERSPLRFNGLLPSGFNALRYVTRYRDLFDDEVDPFDHWLVFGCKEGRLWRAPPETLVVSTKLAAQETVLASYEAILRGEAREVARFSKIRTKMATSSHRLHAQLPASFKPVRYVLLHPDLYAFEVDPYEHYIVFGANEKREIDFD